MGVTQSKRSRTAASTSSSLGPTTLALEITILVAVRTICEFDKRLSPSPLAPSVPVSMKADQLNNGRAGSLARKYLAPVRALKIDFTNTPNWLAFAWSCQWQCR